MRILTGLILCAGFGKRVAPLTNTTPKPLLQIKNVTLLENSINFLKKCGIKKIKIKKLKNDFEILSVLRNLKIIGIFTRLSLRDKKHKYLKFIPYAWKLIQDRSEDIKFKELNVLLNNYIPEKKRLK